MTSHPNTLPDSTRHSTSSPLDRRTTSSTLSSSNHRYSLESNDTAESSSAASLRDGKAIETLNAGADGDGFDSENLEVYKAVKDGKGSHRSHRSRTSGGFLLSTSTFQPPENGHALDGTYESPPRQRHSIHDPKGKSALKSPERRHMKRRSGVGLGLAGSPLASHATSADTANGQAGEFEEHAGKKSNTSAQKQNPTGLDVDSAQIVNLALNLSESRKNASRRITSTPLLHPVSSGIGESIAGGSLRQHLQQQRRVSRNVSPKPDRGERAMTASPRTGSAQAVNSPLQAAFGEQDGSYQYQFSSSTLARAEKAKKTIELMAQYRRLLHYVPPLHPEPLERSSTTSPPGTSHGSPITAAFTSSRPGSAVLSAVPQEIGRAYNPLQYIRNRKVRARNSRTIDGEAQGFGDIEKVSSWIDAVAQQTVVNEDHTVDSHHPMPPFSKEATDAASPHSSPQTNINKGQALHSRPKRPRVDWIINPADMLADIFWLEQDENKKLIENRGGQKIFPQNVDLKRPLSRKGEEPEPVRPFSPVIKKEGLEPDLWVDTKLPEFRSVKADERNSESAASRARQKLRDVRAATRLHHGHNGSINDSRHHTRSRSESTSESSDSDSQRRTRRRRSGTVASQDRERDILEKQMNEMLAREAREKILNTMHAPTNQEIRSSIEFQNSEIAKAGHSRSGSLVIKDRRNSVRNGSSGRASLEVPGTNPRSSLDGGLFTAPSSPQNKARKLNEFVPNMALELLDRDRSPSPTKRHLSRVRSKMRPFYSRNQDSDHEIPQDVDENAFNVVLPKPKEQTPQSPDSAEKRRRSQSPIKKIVSKMTDQGDKPIRKSGSIRRGKGEEASGIRGLFKSNRNPIVKVSDFLWKKDASLGPGTSSGFSTDDSDIEDSRIAQTKSDKKASRESSAGAKLDDVIEVSPEKHKPSFLKDMPNFTQPFERRGRSTQTKADPTSSEPILSSQIRTRAERTNSSRAYLLGGAPRIDIQNASPTSSPDVPAGDQYRDSSVSADESRRSSFSGGVKTADARLNAILGFPGKRRNRLPVTGLSSLETTHDKRPSLDGKRTWSITDRGISQQRGPMTKQEIARVRALLLSSGIKAKEISRRAAELQDLRRDENGQYKGIAALAQEELRPVPKAQEHRLAARILSEDIQLSTRMWHASAESFSNTTIANLLSRSTGLQARMMDSLTPMTRQAADDADEVSKDLVTSQTLKVKSITDKIDRMARRRRRKFRWVRRGGWVMVEWVLVGFMWFVWFMVVVMRVVLGIGKGVVGSLRWLFWL